MKERMRREEGEEQQARCGEWLNEKWMKSGCKKGVGPCLTLLVVCVCVCVRVLVVFVLYPSSLEKNVSFADALASVAPSAGEF